MRGTIRIIIAILAVFILWQVLDNIVHMRILADTYEATADLWRSQEEIKAKAGIMIVAGILWAIIFVLIYAKFFSKKGIVPAIQYGLLIGIGTGFSFGYGLYAVMPIPHSLAISWFAASVVKMTLGGLVIGLIVKE